jgi:hypothetical protein
METELRYGIAVPNIAHQVFGDEVVIINLYSGIYYSLTGTAAQVWIRTIQNYSLNDILADFSLIYEDITAEERQQISELITDLLDKNLITEAQNTTAVKVEFDSTLPKKPFTKPEIEVFSDMQEILLLDPVHDVDKSGWPVMKDQDNS